MAKRSHQPRPLKGARPSSSSCAGLEWRQAWAARWEPKPWKLEKEGGHLEGQQEGDWTWPRQHHHKSGTSASAGVAWLQLRILRWKGGVGATCKQRAKP